jgi:hypothetical protein
MERFNKFDRVLRCAHLSASTGAAFGNLFSADGTITKEFGGLP